MQKYSIQDKHKFDNLLGNKALPGRVEDEYIQKTITYLKYIKWIPGIMLIGIGNSISMNSAVKNSDIDLLIVTQENRMWLARIICTLIFQILGARKTEKKHAGRFCLSFFCTLKGMNFGEFSLKKDPYLYFWILYFKPILDYNNSYNLFIEQNKSWADFSDFENILEKNKKNIYYSKKVLLTEDFSPLNKMLSTIFTITNNLFQKLLLPKTLKSYKKLGKPFGIIIHNDILKFHNSDIRKKIAEYF